MRLLSACIASSLLLLGLAPAWTADTPTSATATSDAIAKATAEMKSFTDAAAAHVRTVGTGQAFRDFQTDGGPWKKGELYLYVYDWNGVCLAHGNKPALVGKNLINMQDKKGNKLIQGLRDTARAGGGTYEFYWENPVAKRVEHKLGYAVKADDTCWLGSGIYLEDAK